MLIRMRLLVVVANLALLSSIALGQPQPQKPAFDVASIRPSQHEVGPDYNNEITYSGDRFVGKNVTLKRLIAEAWHCQMNQVSGPPWIDRNEYDVEARVPSSSSHEQIAIMLRGLLADRFHLKEHSETHEMKVYELEVGKGGPKIKPVQPGQAASSTGPGFHFHGDMRQLADLLAIQFSMPAPSSPNSPVRASGAPIPVLDKTGLQGDYEFNADVRPELGTDAFTAWKRVLEDQLGLKIESRKGGVPVVVVDDAAKVPTEN